MMDLARHAMLAGFINVCVEGKLIRGSVVRGNSNVRKLARNYWLAESMFVREGVILGSVVSVLFKGRELVRVEKEFMKECLVMLPPRFVVVLVIKC